MGEMIVLGLLVGLVFYELTDISPGGLIVPGLLAYYLYDPMRIGLTLLVSVMTYLVVSLLSRHVIVYGKRKFVIMIFIGAFLGTLLGVFTKQHELYLLSVPMIGYIIPGIIANEISKQGVYKTLSALVIVTLITGSVALLL